MRKMAVSTLQNIFLDLSNFRPISELIVDVKTLIAIRERLLFSCSLGALYHDKLLINTLVQ